MNNMKKISVVIPIYNEAKSIVELINRLRTSLLKVKFELIFVDDHSTDETDEICKSFGKNKEIIFLKKKGKKGKAFSLIEGFQASTGDVIAMIDGDLQYPPEAIPEMAKLLDDKADVVVANRKDYKDSLMRKVVSTSCRILLGKLLFGLRNDVQAGLKVMTREALETAKFKPQSAWSFDLEFLHRVKQAGFKIENYDIVFLKRKGESKLEVVRTSFEIGLNALKLRLKRIHPVVIPPNRQGSMLGAGLGFNKKKYITHTVMHHDHSAIRTFTLTQKTIIGLILIGIILGLTSYPLLTLQAVVGILSFIYFADVLFNLYLIVKSLSFPNEITSKDSELEKIDDKKLPIYTILCPLYREAHVLPQFLDSIGKISWPKNKLDVILLLEEDDANSIEEIKKMDLPSYVKSLVVPHSIPKTKPKACNFGLAHAKGEYLVIYDAEDIPDPMQLKKAYLGFKKVDPKVICLQAKLNYYNPHQNLLTRFFTAEYSLWFDVTLTGLQALDTSIPLGGTSNHFKTDSLRTIEGWDPFNVTEDADLGMRLFKKGFRTAIIDSVTLEEANSRIGNWIRQRSRWIKGYMQTYLVHTRGTAPFKKGVHSLIFQLIIGGKIAFVLINPLLWMATIAYFALYAYVGPQIETLYPSLVFYMAITSLVFGNFLFLYYYMIGVAKKEQWSLMKYVLLIPLYWVMISIAASVALYQLIFKPHFWEKTVHGFHLIKENKKVLTETIIETQEARTGFIFPGKLRARWATVITGKNTYMAGICLAMATITANILNFVFNAYLGRVLDFKDFALIGLIGGFLSFSSILFNAFSITVNFRSGFLIGKHGEDAGYKFWRNLRKKGIYLSFIIAIIWFLMSPLLMKYFGTDNSYLFIFFGAVVLVGLTASANSGFLSSKLMFKSLAVLSLTDPIIKLTTAFILIFLGLKMWTFSAIPIASATTFIIGLFIISKKIKPSNSSVPDQEIKKFPIKFFLASLLTGFSTVSFLTFDILLANHFLSQTEAGQYTLLSLVGKMVYFLGGLTSPFVTPLISRSEGANKNSIRTLYFLIIITSILSFTGFIAFGLFGRITVPFLYGQKALAIAPYLIFFTAGMMCYAISRVFINYYLVKRFYTFTIATSLLVVLQVALINKFHESTGEIAFAMSLIWGLHLSTTTVLHLNVKYVKIFENNLSAFFALFAKNKPEKNNNLRILIFNWRDTKHKWAGGAEVYIHELAKRWVKGGNNVTLFCGNSLKKIGNEKLDGVQIIRRGGFYTVYIWALLYYIVKFRGKYDVIIDSENGIPFFTPLYAREKKFLLIHHVHQEVFRKSLKRPFCWLALFLEAKLMPLVYWNTQVITVSPSSKEEILKHKLTRTDPIIIYNGVDLSIFKPGKKSENPLILYLGRLQYYKSLHVFIVAAKKVLKKIPNAEFVIAGEGEEKKKLQKFAESKGILDKVKFLGKVTNEEKISLFQKSWLFVNPSFMEGWGITTIEANACGTPAVASNVPGLRDSIKNPHTGILVKYGNYKRFVESTIKLIEDNKLRKKMSNESIKWSQNFDWDTSANKFLAVLAGEEKQVEKNNFLYLLNRITSLF